MGASATNSTDLSPLISVTSNSEGKYKVYQHIAMKFLITRDENKKCNGAILSLGATNDNIPGKLRLYHSNGYYTQIEAAHKFNADRLMYLPRSGSYLLAISSNPEFTITQSNKKDLIITFN
jgi:hypothetical protein